MSQDNDKTVAQLIGPTFASNLAKWLADRKIRQQLGNSNQYRDLESFENAIYELIRRKPYLFGTMLSQAFSQKQIVEHYRNKLSRYV